MSKRDYRKRLLERRQHIADLKVRNQKHFICESSYETEARLRKQERNHIFADLRAILDDEYAHMNVYNLLSWVAIPKIEMGDNTKSDLLYEGNIFSGEKMLHPFVTFAYKEFRTNKNLGVPGRKALRHLIENVKKSQIFNEENIEVVKDLGLATIPEGNRRDARVFANALCNMARFKDNWIKNPDLWSPIGETPVKQIFSLIQFLFCKYPMPEFFSEVWFYEDDTNKKYHKWFVNMAQGENLRVQKDLPIPITKKVAHYFMQAPSSYSIPMAIRWGQVFSIGGDERVAAGIASTPLRHSFDNNDFWMTVIKFFIENPMLVSSHYRQVYDYIYAQKFGANGQPPPQPNFSMHGREPNTLMRQVDQWHEQLARQRGGNLYNSTPVPQSWESCGIKGYMKEGKNGKIDIHTITEILTCNDLFEEGKAMHHCVGSYARLCADKTVAIFSLTHTTEDGDEKMATIEVRVKSKEITQIRKSCNVLPTSDDMAIIRKWAKDEGLKVFST